jgi:predicted DNA-binding protein
MKTRTQIRLEPEMAARLQRAAEQHGWSIAELIRVCVDHFLPELERKLGEAQAAAATGANS